MAYKGILTTTINDLDFVQTSAACPEQYDVFDIENQIVGYVRLRWGGLTCEYPDCGGELIYEASIGDGWTGCFKSEEQRQEHLRNIADAILKHINEIQSTKKVFCFDNYDNGPFGSWRAGYRYDVVRYDEENNEWVIKDESGTDGIVDASVFNEYFEKVEDD